MARLPNRFLTSNCCLSSHMSHSAHSAQFVPKAIWENLPLVKASVATGRGPFINSFSGKILQATYCYLAERVKVKWWGEINECIYSSSFYLKSVVGVLTGAMKEENFGVLTLSPLKKISMSLWMLDQGSKQPTSHLENNWNWQIFTMPVTDIPHLVIQ